MIEFLTSKSGEKIFKWGGRLLCSSMYPMEEAGNWFHKNKAKLSKSKNIVVLGLGNGFHVKKILETLPSKSVTVINHCNEFVVPATQIIGLRSELVEILTAPAIEDFCKMDEFKNILKEQFSVVEFPPAMHSQQDLYNSVREILMGRTRTSLEFYAQVRKSLVSNFRVFDIKEIKTNRGLKLIDFNSFRKTVDSHQIANQELCALNALGELLK